VIHIVGAGWYGCYLAKRLLTDGHDVRIWEKSSELFSGASSKNQNRLHKGFHYPRNFKTRAQSRAGFDRFLAEFENLTSAVNNNFYAVATDSLIDAGTYLSIYSHEGYQFKAIPLKGLSLQGVDLVLSCDERLIRHDLAADYWNSINLPATFGEKMSFSEGRLRDSKGIAVSNRRDVVIDCTWGAMRPTPEYREEWFMSFLINQKRSELEFDALTVMDGQFFSIFPFGNPEHQVSTLTHVKHGVVPSTLIAAPEVLSRYESISNDAEKILPGFSDFFELDSWFLSRKLKPFSKSDARNVDICADIDNRLITIYSGKIDTVFYAYDQVAEICARL
jgi:hypothetical protein